MKMEVSGLYFSYDTLPILEDISLEVGGGEIMSLVGPNGSGKTTLLRCINRIIKPQKGSILIEGKNLTKLGLKELARYIGYVPQSAPSAFPLTVFDTVLLGRKPHVSWKLGARDKDIAFGILERMGLHDMALRLFNELSGGEKQKVLIARAIAQEPQVLLLDEPTSNLDLKHQLEVLNLIEDLVREKNLSAIMAMHDLNLAATYSNRIIMLKRGQVYITGEPGDVLTTDNIKEIYGVAATVGRNDGRPYIIPHKNGKNQSSRAVSGEPSRAGYR